MENPAGDRLPVYTAASPFGKSRIVKGSATVFTDLPSESIVIAESLALLDLEDLDRESADIIITSILERGYLEKINPGIAGEALLFTLVNEAIQVLEETTAHFSLTE